MALCTKNENDQPQDEVLYFAMPLADNFDVFNRVFLLEEVQPTPPTLEETEKLLEDPSVVTSDDLFKLLEKVDVCARPYAFCRVSVNPQKGPTGNAEFVHEKRQASWGMVAWSPFGILDGWEEFGNILHPSVQLRKDGSFVFMHLGFPLAVLKDCSRLRISMTLCLRYDCRSDLKTLQSLSAWRATQHRLNAIFGVWCTHFYRSFAGTSDELKEQLSLVTGDAPQYLSNVREALMEACRTLAALDSQTQNQKKKSQRWADLIFRFSCFHLYLVHLNLQRSWIPVKKSNYVFMLPMREGSPGALTPGLWIQPANDKTQSDWSQTSGFSNRSLRRLWALEVVTVHRFPVHPSNGNLIFVEFRFPQREFQQILKKIGNIRKEKTPPPFPIPYYLQGDAPKIIEFSS